MIAFRIAESGKHELGTERSWKHALKQTAVSRAALKQMQSEGVCYSCMTDGMCDLIGPLLIHHHTQLGPGEMLAGQAQLGLGI